MFVCPCAESPQVPLAPVPLRQWVVHGPEAPRRGEVEAFIRSVYARRYGADPYSFAPNLVALREDEEIVAAAGYRLAEQGELFLERYLDGPIERVLSVHGNEGVARNAIVEVAHLSAMEAGAGWHLIRWLGPHLAGLGSQWVASTMTEGMRRMFLRVGVAPVALALADPAALGREATRWGSYYDHRPVVVAGHLQQALNRLREVRSDD